MILVGCHIDTSPKKRTVLKIENLFHIGYIEKGSLYCQEVLRKAYVVLIVVCCFGLVVLGFFFNHLLGSKILMILKGNFQHEGKRDFISLLLFPVPSVKG